MGYWKLIVSFHKLGIKQFPSGKEGLKAVKFLRTFFEKRGCESLPRDHPLHNRLGVGAEPNYLWLIQYMKKIQRARIIIMYFLTGRLLGRKILTLWHGFVSNQRMLG